MTTTTTDALCVLPQDRPAWPVAGLLLDALSRRDFAGMGACFDEHVRFRALIPPGILELDSAEAVESRFAIWFGGEDTFEVLDASVGQIGDRLYARWKVRMAPVGAPENARIVEQHLYTRGEGPLTAVDLLCSGFHQENGSQ